MRGNGSKREDHQYRSRPGEGRTHAEMADETDINTIMGKYRVTGFIDHVRIGTPVYGDFATELDFQEAQNALIAAQEIFDRLPARVRRRVDNDPGKLIAFIEDPANADELLELGLKNPVQDIPVPPNQGTEKLAAEAAEQERAVPEAPEAAKSD